MKHLLLATVLLLSGLTPANAWNAKGHMIVAVIAQRHLTPVARAEVELLLAEEGKTSMADVAAWADRVRELKVPAQPAHGGLLGSNDEPYDPKQDCKQNNCILAAIQASRDTLADPGTTPEAKVLALKYLVHLVGDLHMPMHATRAGRGVKVVLRDRETTLHTVWDRDVIDSQRGSAREVAARVEQASSPYTPDASQPLDWAYEGRDITHRALLVGPLATPSSQPIALPNTYGQDSWPVARERLNLAGRRLAEMLNSIFNRPGE